MLWVVATLLPLLAFVIEVLLGRRLGRWSALLATAAMFGSFVLSTIGLVTYINARPGVFHAVHHGEEHAPQVFSDVKVSIAGGPEHTAEHSTSPVLEEGSFDWATVVTNTENLFDRGSPKGVQLGYYIDNITVLMFFMVTLIATCIHVYSIGYMSHEPRFSRFFTYLSLFCFSMLNLVVANNFFQVFISWELVGVCSYFLIGFYYEKRSASSAANKAFITNRVGDVGFLIGLMAIWANFGTFQFS